MLSFSFSQQPSFAGTGKDSVATGDASLASGREGRESIQSCEISETTVSRYMPRSRKPPSQTWRNFLDNHIGELVSIDFFTPSQKP